MIRPLRAIVLEARLDATPAEVWHALTDPRALADWFAPHVTKADQHADGVVEVSWDPAAAWPSEIEIWEPERHLRWTNATPPTADGAPQPRMLMDWFISSEAGATVLRLVHSGFGQGANWDDQIDATTGGWTYFLWNLEVCLTRHRGVHRRMVSTRRRVAGSRAHFWDSLFASGFLTVDSEAGEPRSCTVRIGSHALRGVVETLAAPSAVAAQISSLEDALLFIELEGSAPSGFHVGFWLSTYGVDDATVADLQRSLDVAAALLVEPEVTSAL